MADKLKAVPFPVSGNDFYKTNGGEYVFFTTGPSLTRQEFAEECDINSLMKRYEGYGTGVNGLPAAGGSQPMYVDFVTAPKDLLGYLALMQEAEVAFMSLPAGVRREFENDAVKFVDFASDPENLPQMRTWGLAPMPAVAPEAAPGAVSSSPAPGPAADLPAAPAAGKKGSTHGST